jgi:hypothetical protein
LSEIYLSALSTINADSSARGIAWNGAAFPRLSGATAQELEVMASIHRIYSKRTYTPTPPAFELPDPTTKRWVPRRKAQVVAAVQGGALSLDEACTRYALTVEEFLTWQRAVDRHGIAGLRATHAQEYRSARRH